VKVKICGITNLPDALAAVDAGADALGLNFVGGPRRIDIDTAASILQGLPPLVTPVALVRLEDGVVPRAVQPLLTEFRVRHLQVYGTLTPAGLTHLTRQRFVVMPVMPVRDEEFEAGAREWLATGAERPGAIVLDAFDPSREGGTGLTFPWAWLAAARAAGRLAAWPPIVLAGGLRSANVGEAVRIVQPYAVDVSSGVEFEGQSGRKDPQLMRAFVMAARSALSE
jgi:phosphoribosylanthranilate isomerase